MEMSTVFPPLGSNVVTVDGYNRQGKLSTIRLLKVPTPALTRARLLRQGTMSILQNSMNVAIPPGLTPQQYQLAQMETLRTNLLPPVVRSDYDLPLFPGVEGILPNGGDVNGAEVSWLVGGNDTESLPAIIPEDGFFDFGIMQASGEYATAGIDVNTAGEARVRINGDALDDPAYPSEAGKVIIANGFIEQVDIPAIFAPIAGPALPPGDISTVPPFADIYLERASNAYNLFVPDDFGTLIPDDFDPEDPEDEPFIPFVDADPDIVGSRIVYLNNIFLGDYPVGAPTSTIGYSEGAVTPIGTLPLGVDTFNFLLKVLNPSDTPISIYFELPPGSPDVSGFRFVDIYSVSGDSPYIVPAGGAAFFTMRVEEGTTFIMLDNIIYADYTEPLPIV